MSARGQPVQGKKPQSSHFDFEAFKTVANGISTLQSIGASNRGKYTNLIYELERSIKERDVELFEKTLRQLDKLSVKKIKSQLNDLQAKWGSGKSRGVDPFQNIKLKDDTLTVSVSPAPTTSEKKDAPPSKTRENVDAQRLREIAKILDGDDNQEKGAKQKKSPDIDAILTQIEGACQEVVEHRKKSDLEGINKIARFKPLAIWATEFGKCVEKKTFMEDGIDPSTTNANDKELKAILEQLNRSMKLLYAQKLDQDSLEKTLKNKANELMLILKTQQPTVKDKKKPSGSKDRNIESMDTEKVMDICISELQIRIDHLSNQATRLTQASATLTNTNKKLVAQIEQNKLKQTKKATNNEQNEIIQDLETVTKNIETKLGDLETNCKRYEEVVKKVDEEIEELEQDLEEWDKHKNIVALKEEYEKCSFDALRNSRIKLQKCKTESKETKNKDKGTKIGEKVKKLCGNYGIKTDKKDDYVQMLEDLDKQLKEEKKSLKALEKEICELLKYSDGKNEIPDKASDMSTVDKLSSLIKSANANVVKLKEDCRKDTETAKEEVKTLQSAFLQLIEEVYKLGNEKLSKEISLPIDTMHGEALVHIQKAQSEHKYLEKRLKELQSTFLQVLEDIYELDGTTAPMEVTDPVAMRDNAKQQLQDLKETHKKLKSDLQRDVNDWKERAEKERREKEDYMTRFSKIASAQLTDNNPNIADLSDQNRPTKLAEEYSEIYDNEWTDAYTYLEKEIETEHKRIDKLRQIFVDVYDVCCKIRDQQLKGMKTAILKPAKFYHSQNVQQVAERSESVEKPNAQQGGKGKSPVPANSNEKKSHGGKDDDIKLDPVLSKTLTDIGKETSATTIDDVLEYFNTQHKQLFAAEPMDRYSTKLIRLCWLMRLHSPPVCIDSIEEKGSKFDKTKYRAYTKSGKKIEFVVWPTLLLHENGGMLKQGTAQGF